MGPRERGRSGLETGEQHPTLQMNFTAVPLLFARRVNPEEAFLGGTVRAAGARCRTVGVDDCGVCFGWCDGGFSLLLRPLLVLFPCPYSCSSSSSHCRRCCSAALLIRPVRK